MALQSARDDGFKREALCAPMFTEAVTLLFAQGAELVVIGSAQRGLPMSY
jgi:hypothetical protein